MAYPAPYVRVNILGTAYGEQEIWNTGFNIIMSPNTEVTQANLDNTAALVASNFEDVWSTAFPQQFGQSHRLVSTKASYIGTDGKLIDDLVGEFFFDEPINPGGTTIHAAQVATVVTLRSDVRKGPAALGRMYLPPIAFSVAGDTGMYAGGTAQLAENMRSFFQTINATHPFGTGGVGLTSPVGEGRQSLVTRIGVDGRPDTQRRRANSLIHDISFIDLDEVEE